jgi:Reverse transcriptase (RNA-dependent DNA polymerase)
MNRYPAASRGVGAAQGVPRREVRDHVATFDLVHLRCGHEPDPPDPGGPRLRARGPPGGFPGRDLRRSHTGGSRRHRKDWSNDIIELRGVAGWTIGTQGSLRVQSVQAVQALTKGKRSDGDPARIFPGTSARTENAFIQHHSGLPTLPPCTADERLVCFCIRWQVLQVHRILPFGWGCSPMWFTLLMMPLATKLRQAYRVLAYLDDFLICPAKSGRIASVKDCRRATQTIDKLLSSLGLERHPTKGEWNESTRVEHLGCVVDTVSLRFYVAPRKIVKVCDLARAILPQAQKGIRWASSEQLRCFCGPCVSLSLAVPLARFYTRSYSTNSPGRPAPAGRRGTGVAAG